MKIIFILIWLAVSLSAMAYLSSQKLRHFDPDDSLHFAATDSSFDAIVTQAFTQQFSSIRKIAFHVTDETCSCSSMSESHIRSLNMTFEQTGFAVKTISPETYAGIKSILPSVPALVVFDTSGKLAYLGPYSSGLYCGAKTSLIEPIIASITANKHMGPQVIADSVGCYCAI